MTVRTPSAMFGVRGTEFVVSRRMTKGPAGTVARAPFACEHRSRRCAAPAARARGTVVLLPEKDGRARPSW